MRAEIMILIKRRIPGLFDVEIPWPFKIPIRHTVYWNEILYICLWLTVIICDAMSIYPKKIGARISKRLLPKRYIGHSLNHWNSLNSSDRKYIVPNLSFYWHLNPDLWLKTRLMVSSKELFVHCSNVRVSTQLKYKIDDLSNTVFAVVALSKRRSTKNDLTLPYLILQETFRISNSPKLRCKWHHWVGNLIRSHWDIRVCVWVCVTVQPSLFKMLRGQLGVKTIWNYK